MSRVKKFELHIKYVFCGCIIHELTHPKLSTCTGTLVVRFILYLMKLVGSCERSGRGETKGSGIHLKKQQSLICPSNEIHDKTKVEETFRVVQHSK